MGIVSARGICFLCDVLTQRQQRFGVSKLRFGVSKLSKLEMLAVVNLLLFCVAPDPPG